MTKDENLLPVGWQMSTLAEIATWGSGGTPKASVPQYYGGDIPWAVIGDLTDGRVSRTGRFITEEGLANSSAKVIPAGSVLIAMYGSIGKLGLSSVPMATNQAIAFAQPNIEIVSARYLFWYLWSQRSALISAGKGGAQQNISQGILKAWEIPIPPLAEQGRIVDSLEDYISRLDAAQALVRRCLARLLRLRDEVSNPTFGYAVNSDSEAASLPVPAGTIDGELPRVPRGWRWRRLEDVADVAGGVTKDSKKQSDPDLREVPYLRVANVQRGRLDLDEISLIRVPEGKATALALQPGDVLMNEGGDRDKLGRGWVWEGQVPGAIHQNHVFRARVRDGEIDPKLLSWYANSCGRWFESNGKQSVNLASISLSKIKKFPLPIPPAAEQSLIVERVEDDLSVMENALEIIARSQLRSASLRRALLQRAFSGKLVPQDPNDEPASALFARAEAQRRAAVSKPARRRTTQRTRTTTAQQELDV
ncbi:restriction endonuclease subunit S [Kitasatospora sp. NRRL B-11411]|uniref:restriction endonuclease subunit S n=1 Tax=Kitasatospora sp. NRRL B-11411 TaxID=1463822 RepID=UPI0009E0728D|nr:restriction endonuclease subunit S [Kitasatospora sp. NRRL B-11411]